MDEVIINVTEQVQQVSLSIEENVTPETLELNEFPQVVTLNITENSTEVDVDIVENKQEVHIIIASGSDLHYQHNQLVPLAEWVIEHFLLKHPSVTIVDSAGSAVIGDVVYNSLNKLTVYFSSAFAGTAYLN